MDARTNDRGQPKSLGHDGFVRVRGAREHNLKDVSIDIPRNAFVVFTGVSGSGKSSMAFGTLYAEAQRRYLESVSPYARRLFHQMAVPEVDEIEGLPPAVALQQQRGSPNTRSSVGSVTTLSNLLRMLYSRAGGYPRGQELFMRNRSRRIRPRALVRIAMASAASTKSLSVRLSRTIVLRSVSGRLRRGRPPGRARTFGISWSRWATTSIHLGASCAKRIATGSCSPTSSRLFLSTPAMTRRRVKRALRRKEEPSYQGTFTGVRKYVLQTFATTESAMMKRRVAQFLTSSDCPICHGKRLRPEPLSVTFAGRDIADFARLPLKRMDALLQPYLGEKNKSSAAHAEKAIVVHRIVEDLLARLLVLLDLGLGYLTLERSTPTLSPGELQRLRLATQVRSNLFGVVYVLDEPSAGLHPTDTEALLRALDRLKAAGNSLFVVEHELDVVRHADWIVDIGPGAGEHGGEVLYSGPLPGLADVSISLTRRYLFDRREGNARERRPAQGWLKLRDVTRNNLDRLDVDIPLGVLTGVTSASGSGKSSLISQFLVEPSPKSSASTPTWSKEMMVHCTRSSRPWPAKSQDMKASSGWWWLIKSRSDERRARISQPIPGYSTMSASCSRPRNRPGPGATTPAGSPSTLQRAAARPVRAKALSASSFYFFPASMRPARPARGRAITQDAGDQDP